MFVLTLFANISVSNSLPYQPSIINLICFIYVFLVLGIFIFILLSISIKFEIVLLWQPSVFWNTQFFPFWIEVYIMIIYIITIFIVCCV